MPETVHKGKRKAAIKVGYKSRPGARGGMPGTIQKGRKKGGYKSRRGARGGMPETMQKGRKEKRL